MKDKTASQLQSLEYLGDGTSGEALLTRKIGERSFALHGKVWRQVEYKNEETEKFFRGSRQLRRLEANNPELRPILGLGDHVVFQFDDTWYEVLPED